MFVHHSCPKIFSSLFPQSDDPTSDFHAPSSQAHRQSDDRESQKRERANDRGDGSLNSSMRVSISASAIDSNKYVPILQQRRLQHQQKKSTKKRKKKEPEQVEEKEEPYPPGSQPQRSFLLPPMMKFIDQSKEEEKKRSTKEVSTSASMMRMSSPVQVRISEEGMRATDTTTDSSSLLPRLVPSSTSKATAKGAKKSVNKKHQEGELVIKIKPRSTNRPPKMNPYLGLSPLLCLLTHLSTAHLQPKKVNAAPTGGKWNDNFVEPLSVVSSSSKTVTATTAPSQNQQSVSLSPRRRSERERIPIPVPVLSSPRTKGSTPAIVSTKQSTKKRSSKSSEPEQMTSQSLTSSPVLSASMLAMSPPSRSQSQPQPWSQSQQLPTQPSLDDTLIRIRDELQFLETQLEVKKEVSLPLPLSLPPLPPSSLDVPF
jgi:hypothetical protein